MRKVRPYTICDLSGTRCRNDRMRKTWNGLFVRPELWDPKPKIFDLKAANPEKILVNNARGQPQAIFANYTIEDIAQQVNNLNK